MFRTVEMKLNKLTEELPNPLARSELSSSRKYRFCCCKKKIVKMLMIMLSYSISMLRA